ncbi:MAG: Arc family DNA-binding protein [Acidobacteria bacterium]|nr:Arc family DNA-binding protein [Acidobacteriota bacterium]
MPVDLSIKKVPDDVAERLRARARQNHRSLQGELLSILEEAVEVRNTMTIEKLLERGRERGLSTPDESTAWIRQWRDER